ncbi:MAG: long-chain fatty acid--CoA ligase [Haloarculaceae archaeon]
MTDPHPEPGWRAAEREYTDEVIGDTTIPELFEDSAERHLDSDAQLYKGGVYDRSLAGEILPPAPDGGYDALSYGEMRRIVRHLAAGFRDLGVEPNERVGIYANTRMEWAMTDFALLAAGSVVTTVYTESSPRQVRYLLSDPDAVGVVLENVDLLAALEEVEADLDLEFVVVIDEYDGDREDVYTLAEVHDRGAAVFDEAIYEEWLTAREPGDLASLIYTSGTTGQPKGVRLTHRNFRQNVNQVRKRLGPRPDKPPGLPTLDDHVTSIAFLPLAHVFERLSGHFVMFGIGATVGYVENPDTLAEDIRQIRPNTGASVPRVYERIFDSMREQASESAVKQRIFEWAVDVAREYARTDDPGPLLRGKHGLADRLVYGTVKEQLGGNLEFMVSGGGSLAKDLCETFVGMGLPIVEGYGLTETAPVVSTNPPEDIRPGTLGVPLVDVETRIDESVVDASQFEDVTGAVGELLVRGPNVSDGYWEKPDETARAFTEDGWFRTGDIVERTDDDYLIYHDRIKEILVLSTGKNVAPQPIEDAFSTSDRVDQVMVVGDDRKFVGALIVPNFEQVRRWAEREGIDLPADDDAACEDERVREWVGEAVTAANADLERVERIKEFVLVSREWTAENDLLTPSMKKKRRNIRDAFDEKLEEIYERAAVEA